MCAGNRTAAGCRAIYSPKTPREHRTARLRIALRPGTDAESCPTSPGGRRGLEDRFSGSQAQRLFGASGSATAVDRVLRERIVRAVPWDGGGVWQRARGGPYKPGAAESLATGSGKFAIHAGR